MIDLIPASFVPISAIPFPRKLHAEPNTFNIGPTAANPNTVLTIPSISSSLLFLNSSMYSITFPKGFIKDLIKDCPMSVLKSFPIVDSLFNIPLAPSASLAACPEYFAVFSNTSARSAACFSCCVRACAFFLPESAIAL